MKRHISDRSCSICGGTLRFNCNNNCVSCTYKSKRKISKIYDADRNKRNPWMALLRAAHQRSKIKNIPYDLNYYWARERWTGKCEITGLAFVTTGKLTGGNPFSPSIDKKDSKLGYTKDNCRFVLFSVNMLKHTGTDEQMIEIVNALYKSFNG